MSAKRVANPIEPAQGQRIDKDLLAVFDSLSARIAVLDKHGAVLAVNSAWKQFAKDGGFAEPQCGVGQNYSAACREQGMDDADSRRAAEGIDQVVNGRRQTFEMEFQCRSLGEIYRFALHVVQLRSLGNSQILLALENVTSHHQVESALRHSEERLSAILKCAAEGIVVITAHGVIETFNNAAEKIFGYAATEILGRDVSLLLPEPYDRLHDGFVRNYLQTGQSSIIGAGREVIGRRKDGSQFPMYIAVSEVRSEGQRWFAAIVHDVTAHKLLERQVLAIGFEEQRRIGQDLHDSIGQEVTGLSLSARGLADDLASSARPEAAAAERIAAGLARAQQHIRELSRSLVPREVEAHGLADALEQLAERTASINADVDCTYRCRGQIDVEDRFVATHLYRIAQEAVNNALKHSGGKHVLIEIETQGKPLSLTVRDDGVGIDAVPSTGNGMGLRIMRHRAALIGAALSISRGSGGGTIINCKLQEV